MISFGLIRPIAALTLYGKMTLGPIHGKTDVPEKLFRVAEGHFRVRGPIVQKSDFQKIPPRVRKLPSASDSPSGSAILPLSGPELIFPHQIKFKVRNLGEGPARDPLSVPGGMPWGIPAGSFGVGVPGGTPTPVETPPIGQTYRSHLFGVSIEGWRA